MNQPINDPKVFSTDLRMIDINDPVHKDVMNPLYAVLINNDAFLKEYVDAQITAVIGGSPDALNTLNELASALGDDPNMATTITNLINAKIADLGGAGRTTETVKGVSDLLNTLKNTTDGHIATTNIHRKITISNADPVLANLAEGEIYLKYS